MLGNLTLLSLSLAGSFLASPYLQSSKSSHFSQLTISGLNTKYFFGPFINHQSKVNAHVESSVFSHYLSSGAILSFAETVIVNEAFRDNFEEMFDRMHQEGIVLVTNCQFLSIVDSVDFNPDLKGSCVYIKAYDAQVVNCYFFAVASYRSGGCIYVEDIYNHLTEAVVTGCMFRSVEQYTQREVDASYIYGVCCELGMVQVDSTGLDFSLLGSAEIKYSSITNCKFNPDGVNHIQYGIIAFASNHIAALGLNISHSKCSSLNGQIYSGIYSLGYFSSSTDDPNPDRNKTYTQLNFYENDYLEQGLFSVYVLDDVSAFSMNQVNFIDNNNLGGVGVWYNSFYDNFDFQISLQNIVSNNVLPFINSDSQGRTIVNLTNCAFTSIISSEGSSSIQLLSLINVLTNQPEVEEIELPELSNIPSLELTQTLAFTQSDSFTPHSFHFSPSEFSLTGSGIITAGVLATIFGIISFIAFIFLLYLRRGSMTKYRIIGFFEDRDQFASVYFSESDSDKPQSTNTGIHSGALSALSKNKRKNVFNSLFSRGLVEDFNSYSYDDYSYTYGSYTYSYSE